MKITIINTGGTFNKRYNAIKGKLEIPNNGKSLKKILTICHNVDFEVINIIAKDSLSMNDKDRELIAKTVENCENNKIIIIHGTDTVDQTASYLKEKIKDKKVVFTAAMIPMSIDENEATINFSLALGFLSSDIKDDIYLAMHGVVTTHDRLLKDKKIGKFLLQN